MATNIEKQLLLTTVFFFIFCSVQASDLPGCQCDGEALTEYICECYDLKTFPDIPDNATVVDIKGGDYNFLKRDTFIGANLERISLSEMNINEIEENGFVGMTSIQLISFSQVRIGEIESRAFNSLTMINSTDGEAAAIRFASCLIDDIEEDAFRNIRYANEINFSDNQIRYFDEDAFSIFAMEDGDTVILVDNCDIADGDGFNFQRENVKNAKRFEITQLTQNDLSKDLIGSAETHVMSECSFRTIDEDLTEVSTMTTIAWGQIRVHCGEDIEWLMENRNRLRDEMLNALICSGPGDLEGDPVAELEWDEWEDAVEDDDGDDLSAGAIVGIIIGVIVIVLLIILIIALCLRKQRGSKQPATAHVPPATQTAAAPQPTVSTIMIPPEATASASPDLPPPYDNRYMSEGAVNRAYMKHAPVADDEHQYSDVGEVYSVPDEVRYDNPKAAAAGVPGDYDNSAVTVKGPSVVYDNKSEPTKGPSVAYDNRG